MLMIEVQDAFQHFPFPFHATNGFKLIIDMHIIPVTRGKFLRSKDWKTKHAKS